VGVVLGLGHPGFFQVFFFLSEGFSLAVDLAEESLVLKLQITTLHFPFVNLRQQVVDLPLHNLQVSTGFSLACFISLVNNRLERGSRCVVPFIKVGVRAAFELLDFLVELLGELEEGLELS